MIHYHGTPITPQRDLDRLVGKNFCVSFAYRQNAAFALKYGQSCLWDNGRFTSFTQGREFDIYAFYEWVEPLLGHPHFAVVPDVIGGTEQEQRDLIATWPFYKDFAAPVWHLHLSLDYLVHLVDTWPRVCFGSSAQYWQVGSSSWDARVDAAWDAIAKRRRATPWIHMLRGMTVGERRWPFASADSTNVARNHKTQATKRNECIQCMTRRIDSKQTPLYWPTQFNRGL